MQVKRRYSPVGLNVAGVAPSTACGQIFGDFRRLLKIKSERTSVEGSSAGEDSTSILRFTLTGANPDAVPQTKKLMITTAEFVRFRGFDSMRADLSPHAYIVGPNSAGKSTVLEAINLAEQCLRTARRKAPPSVVVHKGDRWRAYPFPPSIEGEEDPVRHNFGREETRVSIHWATGARIHMIWPEVKEGEEEDRGYFYLEERDGLQPRNLAVTRALFSPVNIVPVVTPLDRIEELKNPAYVEAHISSRLASRHFRNHAWLMSKSDEWACFTDFCKIWLPEIELLDVSLYHLANRLAVFYSEVGSRVPKELAWAGDGIQIWVQLLWHLFRAKEATTIVLDEPEVYLHPDLQRRLVRLLDGMSAQIIMASHSAEVIAEAPPEGVLWVDRRHGGARRAKSQQSLSALSASLGSSYNLALARSMRARLVIATDCEDVRVIRLLANHVGATKVANEFTVSLVQLRGVRNSSDIEYLGASLREVLPQKLPTVVLLNAGHRPKAINDEIVMRLAAPEITVKIWSRSEIENYLLDPETVARVSRAAPEILALHIVEAHSLLRESTRAAFISEWVASAKEGQGSETLNRAEQLFDILWADDLRRVEIVRGTQVIKELNAWLETGGYRLISAHLLAKATRPQSLVPEVLDLLLGIDEIVN
jgi:hypothetical protein